MQDYSDGVALLSRTRYAKVDVVRYTQGVLVRCWLHGWWQALSELTAHDGFFIEGWPVTYTD